MTQNKISIALCTYNGSRYLAEQLESLLAQRYPEIEIVAVDDGSTDDTLEILQRFQARDSRLLVHRNPVNLGFAKNFERALQLCSGDLIAPCDQDDIWDPDKLVRLAGARKNAALVYSDSLLVDEHNQPLGLRASDKLNMYHGSDPRALLFYNCVSGHAMLCTRELVQKALPIPEGAYHDWWLALIAAATDRIIFLDACLVRFRQHSSSTTDLSGSKGSRPRPPAGYGGKRMQQQLEWLHRLKALPGVSQADFCNAASMLIERWQHRYFTPELMRFVHKHRQALYCIPSHGGGNRPWFFLFGLRLYELVKPYKYRTPGLKN